MKLKLGGHGGRRSSPLPNVRSISHKAKATHFLSPMSKPPPDRPASSSSSYVLKRPPPLNKKPPFHPALSPRPHLASSGPSSLPLSHRRRRRRAAAAMMTGELQIKVAQAVHVLNHDSLSCNRVAANQRLVQFQHSDAAWKRDEFRNYNQTPFCKRVHTHDPHSLLSLSVSSVSVSDGHVTALHLHPQPPPPPSTAVGGAKDEIFGSEMLNVSYFVVLGD